ncbi:MULTISPECIES: DeoR/GlpR family DNA-binding transcription regulator [Raoultella]|jgi:DeoR/GlpR family transcriptional regulator of sugar metabolism|uniref:DeoR/GlpR family DNA-binding transcription regulator n=1 Tax=Raoultella planticola TaxID=575 RepID=A0A2X2E7M0_RAOPL|nr:MULTISPECIES: DeoR/GlpR family DNA-binding transcription regulator [Raoultella]EJR0224341.1 DeoR/GlpR transcriptional regulator [Raoultella planticola]EJR0353912.1 DeoR/GlpR transcriptional regulator [Raoultella planticola]EKW3528223.1 DeoR/GlpR transcriptional regulator [Raoultella planticola]EKW5587948.1 DeoR/GlpR transcriptional regulator [Raoultella planticola]ELC3573563.1 DeoR/GlpR transcriptional regulator [Raoultella planticola]
MTRYSKTQRVRRIIEMLDVNHSTTINQLAEYFTVSHMTIRRDIEELQKNGQVKVIFGGQVIKGFINESPEYKDKAQHHIAWKKEIALQAYKLLRPGEIVFMDGGTTVKQLAWLIDIPLTVITNDISTAYILNDRPNIKLLICPGELVRESRSAYCTETLRYLSEHYTDLAFIGADGFDENYGAMTTTQSKADCKWMAMSRAAKSVLLVDKSKRNVFCHYKITDLAEFSQVIVNSDSLMR